VLAIGLPVFADEAPVKLVAVLKINRDLDKRTESQPSTIPNAGNGLFASVLLREGEVIGELGGRLMTPEDLIAGRHYLASIPECAWEETKPYRYLDSKDFGGNVSRINFAPSKINGIETAFSERRHSPALRLSLFYFRCAARHRAGGGDLDELRAAVRVRPFYERALRARFFLHLARYHLR
jgi:hypothetical protein